MRFFSEDYGHSVWVAFPNGKTVDCRATIDNGHNGHPYLKDDPELKNEAIPYLVWVEMQDGTELLSGNTLDGSWESSEAEADQFLTHVCGTLYWNGVEVNVFDRS